MSYNVRGELLGFPDTKNIELVKINSLFYTLNDLDDENISFTVVNPYELREYSFHLPVDVKVLLEINEDSNVSVYNILVIQNPIEKSTINFLAPIIINNDNNKIAQVILEPKEHPDYGMAETIESFKEK